MLAGSLILAAWDLSLDPAMSDPTPYWVRADTGSYYGMPWLNLAGWYVTGLVLMAALAAHGAEGWLEGVSARWLAAFYAALLLMPVGMVALAGQWPALLVALAVLAIRGVLGVPGAGSGQAPVPAAAPAGSMDAAMGGAR